MHTRVQDFVLTSLYAIMNSIKSCVLTINGGSSSIKFALYEIDESLKQLFYGEMEGIGTKHTKLSFTNTITKQKNSVNIETVDHDDAANFLIDWLEKQDGFVSVKAIGHRIVYGMPPVAKLLPIPQRFNAMGIQRYGFHGLSYAYLIEELSRVAGSEPAQGRLILAHLGNGASLAAIKKWQKC